MTAIHRKAGVLWIGDSRSGKRLIGTESKVLYEQPFTHQTRFGDAKGTNLEELIAAAHVRAEMPDMDNEPFQKLIMDADQNCAVSNLLKNGLQLKITAVLNEKSLV